MIVILIVIKWCDSLVSVEISRIAKFIVYLVHQYLISFCVASIIASR